MWATLRGSRIGTRVLVLTALAVLALGGVGAAAAGSSVERGTLAAIAIVAAVAVAVAGLALLRSVRLQLRTLAEEARLLGEAVAEGRVDVRCDASRVGPELAPALEATNQALDAFIMPILVAADCVERISRGDIPAPISETYRGEFENLRQNLNLCIGAVNALVADADLLARGAVEGRLATRADAEQHQGDLTRSRSRPTCSR